MNSLSTPEGSEVIVVIDSLGYGGAERFLVSLLPELLACGIRCEVVALWDPYSLGPEFEARGIKVHRLGAKHRWSVAEILLGLRRILRRKKYDVILGLLYFGQLYAMLSRACMRQAPKVVLSLQSPAYSEAPPQALWPWIRMKIQGTAGRCWADRIVAVSEAVRKDHEDSLGWKNLAVIPDGIPTRRLPDPLSLSERQLLRSNFGVPEGGYLIVVPARYSTDKGHRFLLEALVLLRDQRDWEPHCIAAGHGPLKPTLEALRRDWKLEKTVQLLDPLPQMELFSLIQSADAVALPSLQESQGLAAVESMALGIPTIITDHYGFREVDGGTQATLMAKPADAQSLADALWRLKTEPGLAPALSRNGRKRAIETFDITGIARRWAKLLRVTSGTDKPAN